ncbi:MAG TPA: hypothetical protein VGB26_11005 [Nitrospiria bacterium]|jgi:hypothetical protein
MNKKGIEKLIGRPIKIRPKVKRVHGNGTELSFMDYDWYVELVSSSKGIIRLSNPATGHSKDLGMDNFYEFRTPNFLILKCQLTLKGYAVLVEPSIDPRMQLSRPKRRSGKHW